jgi:hypothetical protein
MSFTSCSECIVPQLMLGIGFLPSIEHLTNSTIRSAFVSYQWAGPVESAIETEDDHGQDILDIINAYLDPDMLSDMGEYGEFTDTTDIIRLTTHFYNINTQQEVEHYTMNHLTKTNPCMNLKTLQSAY